MNKRVLWAMIVLLWMFLICFSLLKLFFADWLVATVENERVLEIGDFIDHSRSAKFIADFIVSMLIWHFYLCSCKRSWRLSAVQYGIAACIAVVTNIGYIFIPSAAMYFDLIIMLVLPVMMQCDCKQIIAVYVLHNVGQMFMLFIRSEPLYLANTNYATQFLIVLDMYVWLLLYYTYSNLYKEETLWENLVHPFSAIRRLKNLKKKS